MQVQEIMDHDQQSKSKYNPSVPCPAFLQKPEN